ncbi:MAG TPA: hypothetical protein VMB52_02930, partial [Verrucomicrobiae bacterium]|nr:hypothetical protein [Verrucomicrobiae bacterium]
MLTKHSVLRILRNPLVTIPPLVLILSLGWHQYTYAGRNFNLPDPHLNLLADSDFRSLDADQLPTGWQVTSSDTLGYTAASVAGYAGGSSLQLTVNNYHSGDLVLATPKVPLSPSNNTYLFKGYYRAGAPFALLVRSYFSNGSSSTQLAQVYPATGDTWTTTSDAFQATTNLVAVQILFRLYTNGSLTLNEPYLQPQPDVYIAPATKGTNILPNSQLTGDLAGDGYDAPAGWSTYQTGSSNTSFLYAQ